MIKDVSTFPETVLGLDVGFHVPIEFVLALVVLLVLGGADVLHLLIVVVVQFVVGGLLLPEIDVEVLLQVILLDAILHLLQLE